MRAGNWNIQLRFLSPPFYPPLLLVIFLSPPIYLFYLNHWNIDRDLFVILISFLFCLRKFIVDLKWFYHIFFFLFWKIVTLIETKFKISQKFAVGLILRLSMENVSSWNLDSIKLDIKMELHTFPILSSCKFPACNTLHDIIPEVRGPSRPRVHVGGSLASFGPLWPAWICPSHLTLNAD